jgi:Restriction endonuclease S subunits
MSKENKIVPKLRFPEFTDNWKSEELGHLAGLITEQAGNKKYKLMSVTAGVGLVSQMEKFGREIAGNSYKNYYVLRKGEFAYNKSSTKLHPEGQIALLEKEEIGAVPNSIFTCFQVNEKVVSPYFLKYPFENNVHGNWLRKFIAIGARANGALNVDNRDLLSLPLLFPSLEEQQKIADCLSSLDDLISAHSQKLDALKDHKKGLMQLLFPAEGETVPKLRFKEFENDGEWEVKKLEDIAIKIQDGTHFSPKPLDIGPFLYVTSKNVKNGYLDLSNAQFISIEDHENIYKRCDVKKGDVLLTKDGTIGQSCVNELTIPFSLLSSVAFIRLKPEFYNYFLYHLLISPIGQKEIESQIAGQALKRITLTKINNFNFYFPTHSEQEKIANSLSSIDEQIKVQIEKIDALKAHKKGLMQQLFPSVLSSR